MERKLSKTLGELFESVRHMNVDIMPFARAIGAAEDLEKLVEKAGAGEHIHVALSLGEVIEKLEACKPDVNVYFDFGCLVPDTGGGMHSYRGYYEDVAMGWRDPSDYTDKRETPKVAEVLEMLKDAVGATFGGWKGGEFTMDKSSRLWVDNAGTCNGVAIVEVDKTDWAVHLRTWMVDR